MDTPVTSSHLTTEPHSAAALPVANLFNKASHHPRCEASCCLQLLSRGYKTFCSQWHHGVQGEHQPAPLQHLCSARCGARPATAGSVLLLSSAPEGDAESRPQHTGKTSPALEHISWNCLSISLSARTLTPGDATCLRSSLSVGCFFPFSPPHSPWTREFAITQQSFSFVVCKLE